MEILWDLVSSYEKHSLKSISAYLLYFCVLNLIFVRITEQRGENGNALTTSALAFVANFSKVIQCSSFYFSLFITQK